MMQFAVPHADGTARARQRRTKQQGVLPPRRSNTDLPVQVVGARNIQPRAYRRREPDHLQHHVERVCSI